MFYGHQIQETRQFFSQSFEKYQKNLPMTDLEKQIVAVILEHPEYHALFTQPSSNLTQSYFPELGETNPFLHLGLHLGIREQIATDRPQGIRSIFNQLIEKYADKSMVEHLMMERLAECLWAAQRENQAPNEINYLNSCLLLLNA